MRHLIESRQNRPSDDPIFALNREATERRKKGESIVNATVGALLDDAGKLAVLPTSARALREVPEEGWAAYAPIAGGFLTAAGRPPRLPREAARERHGRGHAGRHGRAPPRDRSWLQPGRRS
jgi:hypothetical protein